MEERLNQLEDDFSQCKSEVGKELEKGNLRMDALQKSIDEVSASVEELLSIFRAADGFGKVMGWIGVFLKWVAGIGVAIGVIYAAMKGLNK